MAIGPFEQTSVMSMLSAPASGASFHDQLVEIVLEGNKHFAGRLTDSTSLIRSGLLDSLGLLNVALFVEKATGGSVDVETLDVAREWDTITDIVQFIEQFRSS
jgi:acyl carrier protein